MKIDKKNSEINMMTKFKELNMQTVLKEKCMTKQERGKKQGHIWHTPLVQKCPCRNNIKLSEFVEHICISSLMKNKRKQTQ